MDSEDLTTTERPLNGVQKCLRHLYLTVGTTLVFVASSACVKLNITSLTGTPITGSAAMFSTNGTLALSSQVGLLSSNTCSSATVSLHALTSDGSIDPNIIMSAPIASDGSFTLSGTSDKGVKIDDSNVSYVLQAAGCGSVYYRPLTDFSSQTITGGSTILAMSANVSDNSKRIFQTISRSEVSSAIKQIDSVSASDLTSLVNQVVASTSLTDLYQKVVNLSPTVLQAIPPDINSLNAPLTMTESSNSVLSASLSTWNQDYQAAYEWSLDGTVVSTSATWSYTTNQNSQGPHTVTLRVGSNSGGVIDSSKPVNSKSSTFTVSNDFPAIAPSFTLVGSSPVSTLTGTVIVNTGASLTNCSTFSNLALTENAYVAPLSASSYSIACSQSGTQTVPFTLSSGDGVKTLALWARDAAGNVSMVPTTVSLVLDQNPPMASLGSVSSLAGGSTANLSFAASDAGSGVQHITLAYASDGVTFSNVADLTGQSSPFAWTVPSANTSTAKIRLIVTDNAGNSTQVTSNAFTIDSTPPSAPTASLTSATYTSSLTTSWALSCVADDAGILFSESATPPTASSGAWQTCAATMTYTLSAGDATKTVYVYAKDAVGNVSSATTATVVYDSTPPVLAFVAVPATAAASAQMGGGTFSLQWNVTESNITTSQSYAIDYSTDGGSTWSSAGSVASTAGPLSAQTFTKTITWPSVDTTQAKVRVSAVDRIGNTSTLVSSAFTIDNTAPTLSSFQLAGGAATVAIPTVTFALSATDALSTVAKYQISESPTYSGSGWLTYASSGAFTLSQVNGPKTVYAWVMDGAGNVSAPLSVNITYSSSIPNVTVTSPVSTDTFTTGQTVNIAWTCSNTDGLDAAPVSLQYTSDDGATFTSIATGLTNNLTSTTGTYPWTLPVGVLSFRLSIGCKSASGVVANIYSPYINTAGWSVYAGDPWYGKTNIAASIAKVTGANSSGNYSVYGDDSNNTYYVNYNSVMKISANTGYVTTFVGTGTTTCTSGTGVAPLSGGLKDPVILGLDSTRQYMFLADDSCGKIFRITLADATVTTWETLPTGALLQSTMSAGGGNWFMTQNRTLIFLSSTHYLYKLDLNTQSASATVIMGDGTVTGTMTANRYAVGTLLLGKQIFYSGNGLFLAANADASMIYIDPYGFGNYTRYDWNGTGYQVGVADGGAAWQIYQNCISADFDTTNVYCPLRAGSPGGRKIYMFNPTTATFSSTFGTVPIQDNYNGASMTIGAMRDRLVSIYTANSIDTIVPVWGGTWTYVHVAGEPLNAMGNGTDLSQVGFDGLLDLKYNATTSTLWVATNMGYVRRFLYSGSTVTVSSVYNSGVAAMFGGQFNMNLAGTKSVGYGSCARDYIVSDTFNPGSPTTFSSTAYKLGGSCDLTTYTNAYPAPSGYGINADLFYNNLRSYSNEVYASNGLVYFSTWNASPNTNDEFIYSSDGTMINRVAGVTGTGSYVVSDSGGTALSATLKRVWQMQEVSSGAHQGDLLIWDGDMIRLITVATESASPKIYDLFSMTIAAGYTAGSNIIDFIYDSSTETSSTLGTGTIYYVTSGNVVHKFVPNSTMTSATDTTYSFSGTTLSGVTRIALHPAEGLLVLQKNQNRILRIAP